MPARIVNIADEALSTPQGQQLRGVIEGFESQMRASNAGNALNPFQNTQSATGMGPPGGMAAPRAAPAASGGTEMSAAALEQKEALKTALEMIGNIADSDRKRGCLGTVSKMVQNIVDKPGEEKFRKVRDTCSFLKFCDQRSPATSCSLHCNL